MWRDYVLKWVVYLLAGLAVTAVLYDFYRHLREDTGANNLHALQADAFLHGRIELDRQLQDAAIYKGKIYSYAPPFPAFLLVPVVATFGVNATNPFAVKLALTIFNVWILRGILRRLGTDSNASWWLTAAFLGGSAYWFVVTAEGVWWFSQVVGVTCMLLALRVALVEVHGTLLTALRALAVGLILGCAFLSRQMYLYSSVFLLVLLWMRDRPALPLRLLSAGVFSTAVAAMFGIYLWFNWARFENPFEAGSRFIPVGPVWTENVSRYGIFNVAYVPFNLMQLLFQGFHFELSRGQFKMDRNGTSILFASPWIFAAVRASWDRPLLIAAWASVLLTLAHQMVYYSNGWAQVNAQRYTLDFLPILLPLVALGVKRCPPALWKGAVAYSVGLNFLALVLLPRGWSLLTRFMDVAIGPSAAP